jgi:hypothetical protein
MGKIAEPVLSYEAAAQGEPVILLHGEQLDCRMWDDQFLLFAKDFRIDADPSAAGRVAARSRTVGSCRALRP